MKGLNLVIVLLLLTSGVGSSGGESSLFWSLYRLPKGGGFSFKECSSLLEAGHLNQEQFMMCVNEPGVLRAVVKGLHRAVHYCQLTFKHNPWDCRPDTSGAYLYRRLQLSSTPESGYLRAAIGASLVYEIATACRQGYIPNCPCGSVHKFIQVIDGTRVIGGCDINIPHAVEKARVFISEESGSGQPRGAVNSHNDNLGQLIGGKTERYCRCHGVTSSCAIKVCHQKLVSYQHNHPPVLYQKYNNSQLVSWGSSGQLVTNSQHPVAMDTMVHLDPSINSCVHTSTVGRLCLDSKTCRRTCCSGQYRVESRTDLTRHCSLVLINGEFRNICRVAGTKMVMEYRCR